MVFFWEAELVPEFPVIDNLVLKTLSTYCNVAILPMDSKELHVSPRFSPTTFIAMQVQPSYTSPTDGRLVHTHVPTCTYPVRKAE